MNFPKTKKENIVDDLFGYKISDPFRWLENGEDAEVKKWIDDQNEATFSSFKDAPSSAGRARVRPTHLERFLHLQMIDRF